jgi:hypothetical protein
MELDHEKGASMRAELEKIIVQSLFQGAKRGDEETVRMDISQILDAGCTIESPEKEPQVGLITAQELGEYIMKANPYTRMAFGGRGPAKSLKPGNILLDVRKLLATVAKVTLSMAGVIATPWTTPLAFLILWDELWSRASVDIQEREATVMWALWANHDTEWCVQKDHVLNLVNTERAQHGRSALTSQELNDSLGILVKIKCIEEPRNNPSKWLIREWVKVTFN